MPEQMPENAPVSLEQAFKNVDAACAVFQGNRADHVTLQNSLRVIGVLVAQEINKQKDPEVENPPQEDETEEDKGEDY